MKEKISESPLTQAIQEAEKGNSLLALMYLEKIPKEERTPLHNSYRGYCLAKGQNQFAKAFRLCEQAVRQNPRDPVCYLNFGRVCIAAGKKNHAIRALRQSLKVGCLPQVVSELEQLGIRKSPTIPALPRDHFLNRHLGLLFKQLGLR